MRLHAFITQVYAANNEPSEWRWKGPAWRQLTAQVDRQAWHGPVRRQFAFGAWFGEEVLRSCSPPPNHPDRQPNSCEHSSKATGPADFRLMKRFTVKVHGSIDRADCIQRVNNPSRTRVGDRDEAQHHQNRGSCEEELHPRSEE